MGARREGPRSKRENRSEKRERTGRRRALKRRVRRSPEEAKALILEAAKKVLGAKGPDAAGLKDVAREAGVSHALVTHYFGTFDALVDATLEAHVTSVRAALLARLAEAKETDADELLSFFFDSLTSPGYGRLAAWALLSGRLADRAFFPRRQQGLRVVADAVEARYRELGRAPFVREELEQVLVLTVAAGYGYALGRELFWEMLGHTATAERDARFRAGLGELIRRYLGI